MGTSNKKRLRIYFTSVLFFLVQNICFSQTTIFGSVREGYNNLYSVNVILKDSISKSIIAFTYTDDKGNFLLKTKKTGVFNLIFTSLGYEPKTFSLI